MKIKALAVDRRSTERNLLTRPLKQIGVKKVVEVTAEEFTAELFETGNFDVVFIEFNTLMEAGRNLAKSLRQMDDQIPIIVTYPESVTVADLQKYCPDVTACLMTPFTNEQLREAVEQHVLAVAN
jgi:DNA-binding NtrC family response regulator